MASPASSRPTSLLLREPATDRREGEFVTARRQCRLPQKAATEVAVEDGRAAAVPGARRGQSFDSSAGLCYYKCLPSFVPTCCLRPSPDGSHTQLWIGVACDRSLKAQMLSATVLSLRDHRLAREPAGFASLMQILRTRGWSRVTHPGLQGSARRSRPRNVLEALLA